MSVQMQAARKPPIALSGDTRHLLGTEDTSRAAATPARPGQYTVRSEPQKSLARLCALPPWREQRPSCVHGAAECKQHSGDRGDQAVRWAWTAYSTAT